MAILYSYPLSTSFAGVYQLQAMNQFPAGDVQPNGIAGSLEIINGVMVSTIRDTDPETASGIRAEIQAPPEANAERWYYWEMMVPTSFDDAQEFTLMQIHDTPDGGDPNRAPNFVLTVQLGQLRVVLPSAVLPAENNTGKTIYGVDLIKGKWYKCCLHVDWQPNATGFRELFIDGVPVIRQMNTPTHYVDVVGPYFKLGVYNHRHVASFGVRTAYYKNVVIRSGNDGYNIAMGQLPTQPKTFVM